MRFGLSRIQPLVARCPRSLFRASRFSAYSPLFLVLPLRLVNLPLWGESLLVSTSPAVSSHYVPGTWYAMWYYTTIGDLLDLSSAVPRIWLAFCRLVFATSGFPVTNISCLPVTFLSTTRFTTFGLPLVVSSAAVMARILWLQWRSLVRSDFTHF